MNTVNTNNAIERCLVLVGVVNTYWAASARRSAELNSLEKHNLLQYSSSIQHHSVYNSHIAPADFRRGTSLPSCCNFLVSELPPMQLPPMKTRGTVRSPVRDNR